MSQKEKAQKLCSLVCQFRHRLEKAVNALVHNIADELKPRQVREGNFLTVISVDVGSSSLLESRAMFCEQKHSSYVFINRNRVND